MCTNRWSLSLNVTDNTFKNFKVSQSLKNKHERDAGKLNTFLQTYRAHPKKQINTFEVRMQSNEA